MVSPLISCCLTAAVYLVMLWLHQLLCEASQNLWPLCYRTPITSVLVYSQQVPGACHIQGNNYFTSLSPTVPVLMFVLFNNLDSIWIALLAHKFIYSLWLIALISTLQDALSLRELHNIREKRWSTDTSIYTKALSYKSNNLDGLGTSFIADSAIDFSIMF